MKKIYVIPEISTTKVVVGRMIAGSFKGQLGTEGMSGELHHPHLDIYYKADDIADGGEEERGCVT